MEGKDTREQTYVSFFYKSDEKTTCACFLFSLNTDFYTWIHTVSYILPSDISYFKSKY